MQALNNVDFQNLALELRDELVGAHVQEVWLSDHWLAFKFYRGSIRWLVFDLDIRTPQLALIDDIAALKRKEEKKPIVLFVRAHFRGQRLERLEHAQDYGRVLIFHFKPGYEIEMRLFPHGANAIARTPDKELALHKPSPLKPMPNGEGAPSRAPDAVASARSLAEHSADCLRMWTGVASSAAARRTVSTSADRTVVGALATEVAAPSREFEKKMAKLQKAIVKVKEDLALKQSALWQQAGEWLKSEPQWQAIPEVPAEFQSCINLDVSWAENIEHCFKKAKDNKLKIAGSEQRLRQLEAELVQLESAPDKMSATGRGAPAGVVGPRSNVQLLAKADARGRTFPLEGGMVFYVGKSAQDNLRLLREAKAWHLWLHLRDVPGCHGILTRNKNQVVSDAQMHQAAHDLIATQFGSKASAHENEKFDIYVTECRHVRPIKGDRHGQVTHSHSRLLTHQFRMIKFL